MIGEDYERAIAAKLDDKATQIRNFLWNQGFYVAKEEGNLTAFNFEGGRYVIETSDTDVDYLRLMYPWFYSCSRENGLRAVSAANLTNIKMKICKVIYSNRRKENNGEIVLAFDVILESFFAFGSDNLDTKFMRYLKMIRATRDTFTELVNAKI